uniref:Uncharacterized protein n=1 Tax=Panagrellus redivivus TaxID=6233 RepID=A0A7E4W102_PANRE
MHGKKINDTNKDRGTGLNNIGDGRGGIHGLFLSMLICINTYYCIIFAKLESVAAIMTKLRQSKPMAMEDIRNTSLKPAKLNTL